METPSNPTNDLVDIEACARVAREFSTERTKGDPGGGQHLPRPRLPAPPEAWADLVIYSLTKYVGGHSDLIAGAVLGSKEDVDQVKGTRTFFGNIAGPFTGFLLMRSLETLKVRMVQETENARKLADFLTDHPKVARVSYLGLLKEGDEGFEIYQRHCTGPGSMIAFEVHGGEAGSLPLPECPEAHQAGREPGGHRVPGGAPRRHDPLRHSRWRIR